jgi:RNA polymerase sigma factor (sigma-70 family)
VDGCNEVGTGGHKSVVRRSDAAEDQFTDLYRENYWFVLRFLRRRLDEATARDAAAEVFLVAWRRLDDVPGPQALPWLLAVARLTLANARRAKARRLRLVERVQGSSSEAVEDDGIVEAVWVRDALAKLSASDQEILRLSAWEDLSGAQIAQALDCSQPAAAVRLHRARSKLRAALDAGRNNRDTWMTKARGK